MTLICSLKEQSRRDRKELDQKTKREWLSVTMSDIKIKRVNTDESHLGYNGSDKITETDRRT